MSQLKSNRFACKECGRLLNPRNLASSSEYCFAVGKNDKLKKTPYTAARCKCGRIGVFPRYSKAETYFKHMKSDVSFHLYKTEWIEEYMKDPDRFFQKSPHKTSY